MPLAKDIIWASGLRVGAIPGENPFLILEDRFRTGGPYSVRGFWAYILDPQPEEKRYQIYFTIGHAF